MFGYIICNRNELSKEEIDRYRSVYCGLCMALKKRYGQLERFSLSFDMTFLAIFLNALYETEETSQEIRCVAHPLSKKNTVAGKYVDYAADMTILLSYFKCLDDWEDERKHKSHIYGKVLKKDYMNIKEKYPRQCRSVEESLKELSIIEKSQDGLPDEAVNCSGKMMSELFVYEEDFWSKTLRQFGYELGRFIYLMDAVMDYKMDLKKGNYNPLVKMGKKPEEMEEILSMAIANATACFERLPIIQDEHIIKNVLYGGVWQQYYTKVIRKGEKDGK